MITLYNTHHLVINSEDIIQEDILMLHGGDRIQVLFHSENIQFHIKFKAHMHKFRLKFYPSDGRSASEVCSHCCNILSSYVPVKALKQKSSENEIFPSYTPILTQVSIIPISRISQMVYGTPLTSTTANKTNISDNNRNNKNTKNNANNNIEQLPLAYQNTEFLFVQENDKENKTFNNNQNNSNTINNRICNNNSNNNISSNNQICSDNNIFNTNNIFNSNNSEDAYMRDVLSLCLCDSNFPTFVAGLDRALQYLMQQNLWFAIHQSILFI